MKNKALKKTAKKQPLAKRKLQPKTATQNQVLKEITLSQKQEETQNPLAKNTEPLAKINHRVQRKKTWKNIQNSLQKKKTQKKKHCKNKQTQNTLQQKKQPLPQKTGKKNTKTLTQTITKSIEKNHQSKK